MTFKIWYHGHNTFEDSMRDTFFYFPKFTIYLKIAIGVQHFPRKTITRIKLEDNLDLMRNTKHYILIDLLSRAFYVIINSLVDLEF